MESTINTSIKKNVGPSLIIFILATTLFLWFSTLQNYEFIKLEPFLFFSKIFALTGTIAMCCTFILATRAFFLETLFGGLEKVYYAHQYLGKISYLCIFLHTVFQFLRFVPDWNKAFSLFMPTQLDGVTFGILAFLLFTLLTALTIVITIPYHIWKRTHEFFIIVLLLTFLHIFFINKHVNASPLLSAWIYGFMGLAGVSYLYIRFLYRFIGPLYHYNIDKIEHIRKTWNIYLTPSKDKVLNYKPGQFIYVSFDNDTLGKESHPFSISSHPEDNFVRLSIKELGDYTSKLKYLQKGGPVRLWGPYGKFYEKYLYQNNKDAVFFAGGIGITPFLSMIKHEAYQPQNRDTYLFFCVKDKDRADFDTELRLYTKHNPRIHYMLYCVKTSGFITAKKVSSFMGDLKNKNFFLCGPKGMMDSLTTQLKAAGVRNNNIITEDFNFF